MKADNQSRDGGWFHHLLRCGEHAAVAWGACFCVVHAQLTCKGADARTKKHQMCACQAISWDNTHKEVFQSNSFQISGPCAEFQLRAKPSHQLELVAVDTQQQQKRYHLRLQNSSFVWFYFKFRETSGDLLCSCMMKNSHAVILVF